jgi:hypothetical protein
MFGIVPISRELIRSSNEYCPPFYRKGFGGFKPGLKSLVREFLASAIENALPDFGGTERHDATP